jgi:hypothetical protein
MSNRIETSREGSHKKYEVFRQWLQHNFKINPNIFKEFEEYWNEYQKKRSVGRFTVKDRNDSFKGEPR